MSEPLVTIITPSFNQAQYIKATIDSILAQDYHNIEYLVFDGGSTDSTVEILKTYTDPRLKWVSEPDRGQSHALNKGLQQAQGEIIAYLNSDDVYLPGAISATVAAFQDNPSCDLIYGDCIFIDETGSKIGAGRGAPIDLKQALVGRVFVPQQTAFWRRRVTDSIGLFDEHTHYTMDIDYWLRALAKHFQPCYVSGERAGYRLHRDSKTVSQVTRFWSDWDKMIEQFFAQPDLEPEILQLKPITRITYYRMYTLSAPWMQGYRAELRPLLKQIINGPVPFSHRVIGTLMFVDSYLGTALADGLLSLVPKLKRLASQRSSN